MDSQSIKLSKVERQSFIFQLRILQNLTDDEYEKKEYENKIAALANGYELHYQDIFEELSDEEMSSEECREVLEILEMYRGIIYSFNNLKRDGHQGSIKESDVAFEGFDGNYETKYMFYTRYFIIDLDRYSEIQAISHPDYNSHRGMLSQYRHMLTIWREYRSSLQNAYLMNEEQLHKLLDAR